MRQLAGLGGLVLLGGTPAASGPLAAVLSGDDRTKVVLIPCSGDWRILETEEGELRYTAVVGLYDSELGGCICDQEQELLDTFDDILGTRNLDGWSYLEPLEGIEEELLVALELRCPAVSVGDDDDSAAPSGYAWLELDCEFRSDEIPLMGVMAPRSGWTCSLSRSRRGR